MRRLNGLDRKVRGWRHVPAVRSASLPVVHQRHIPSFVSGMNLDRHPVLVSLVHRRRVVHTEDDNVIYLQARAFQLQKARISHELAGDTFQRLRTLLTTQPNDQVASAPGKIYL